MTTNEPYPHEKRQFERKPVVVRARISAGAGSRIRECTIADVSAGGAKIVIEDGAKIPDRFTLMLSANGSVQRKCKVAWRRGPELGVQWAS